MKYLHCLDCDRWVILGELDYPIHNWETLGEEIIALNNFHPNLGWKLAMWFILLAHREHKIVLTEKCDIKLDWNKKTNHPNFWSAAESLGLSENIQRDH